MFSCYEVVNGWSKCVVFWCKFSLSKLRGDRKCRDGRRATHLLFFYQLSTLFKSKTFHCATFIKTIENLFETSSVKKYYIIIINIYYLQSIKTIDWNSSIKFQCLKHLKHLLSALQPLYLT